MRTYEDLVNSKLADIARVTTAVGVFVGMDGGLAKVNLQGATVRIRCDGFSPPAPNIPVRVDTVGGIMRVTGPAQALNPRGTVTAVGGGSTTVTVEVGGTSWDLPVLAGYSPMVGEVVVINWQSGHVLGEEASAPEPTTPEDKPEAPTAFSNLLVYPTGSGKYDDDWNNWWGGAEVWASNSNDGIWVYGGRFSTLNGADVAKTEMYLPRLEERGVAFIGLHGYSGIPSGAPTITDTVALSPRNGWVTLPSSWGNHLRDNPNAGIGVTSGAGFNRWAGAGQHSLSGALRFAGTR